MIILWHCSTKNDDISGFRMMTFLQLPVCLFLVVTLWVTPLCAAPAASPAPAPSLRPVSSSVLVKRDSEAISPGLSGFTCDKSGIFADQDTGCQVSVISSIPSIFWMIVSLPEPQTHFNIIPSIFKIGLSTPNLPKGLYQFTCVWYLPFRHVLKRLAL